MFLNFYLANVTFLQSAKQLISKLLATWIIQIPGFIFFGNCCFVTV